MKLKCKTCNEDIVSWSFGQIRENKWCDGFCEQKHQNNYDYEDPEIQEFMKRKLEISDSYKAKNEKS